MPLVTLHFYGCQIAVSTFPSTHRKPSPVPREWPRVPSSLYTQSLTQVLITPSLVIIYCGSTLGDTRASAHLVTELLSGFLVWICENPSHVLSGSPLSDLRSTEIFSGLSGLLKFLGKGF